MDVTDPPQLVRIAMASGQDAMARATSAVAGERALINPDVSSVGGAAAHCRGLLESDVDELITAVELGPLGRGLRGSRLHRAHAGLAG
jgi:hypothetical protein